MANNNQELTFDCMPNAVQDVKTNECPSILDEIDRCRKLYHQRQALKRKKTSDIKPLYYEQMRKRDLVAKYPVYKFRCIYPKPSKNYDPCRHMGQIIIDRDILSKDEHINFLAQPKRNCGRFIRPPRCVFEKRFLPNCTTRIESLAHPKPTRVKHNWQDYSHLLSVRQAENLRRTLQRPPIEYTTIANAITYIHEERRLTNEMKNEELKRRNQIKRKLLKIERRNMTKIILALYEVMKDFLMSEQFVMDSSELSNLCLVLENAIVKFSGLDNGSTSHVQQLTMTVAQNLAIWIEKFTSNCGFHNARVQKETKHVDQAYKPTTAEELVLPVDDFIPYHSPSVSDLQEAYTEAEDFDEMGEYEDDNK